MGFFDWIKEDVLDDVLGFDSPEPSAPAPPPPAYSASVGVATPIDPQAQDSQVAFDNVQSYLQFQAQKAYSDQLKKSATPSAIETPAEKTNNTLILVVMAVIAIMIFKG